MTETTAVTYQDNGLAVTVEPGRVTVTLDGATVYDSPWAGGPDLSANRQAFSALSIVQSIGQSNVPAGTMHLPAADLIESFGQDRVRQASARFEALRWTIPQ
jgi:hypothetical protein